MLLPTSPEFPTARWWQVSDPTSGKVTCQLCPRECQIPPGGQGFCFVRANHQGRLVLTTWGRSSGFCVDPIEKKPLNHFLPGSAILSFGTAGCNLGCRFCQNWDISKSRQMDRLAQSARPETIVQAARRYGCRSIAFTYNEPIIFAEYAIDVARAAREAGIKTVAVTAGYINPEPRKEFFAWMDAANVDLKGFTEKFYRELCQAHLQPVLDTLVYLKKETSVWLEITNLMIPGWNDSPEETRAMCQWILENLGPDVPVHFTAFHPDFRMLDVPPTPLSTLQRARKIAQECGIRFVYLGNVSDWQSQSTFCPSCGRLLIRRDWYQLGDYHIRDGRCAFCGTVIPGIFENAPGEWGGRRLPVYLEEIGEL